MMMMLPGGLTAAVLAQLAFTSPMYLDATSAYHAALEPYRMLFINTVFFVIVACVAITTVGVFVWERERMTSPAQPAAQAKPAPAPVPRPQPAAQPRPTFKPAPAKSPAAVRKPLQPQPATRAKAAPPAQSQQPPIMQRRMQSAEPRQRSPDASEPRHQRAFQSTVVMVMPPVEKKRKDEDEEA
jgi:outer membrane biosynthesis protein TonB